MESKKARWVTLAQLKKTLLPGLFNPMPSDVTLRSWLESAGVPSIKTNEKAQRGGGPLYYLAESAEQVFSKFGGGQ